MLRSAAAVAGAGLAGPLLAGCESGGSKGPGTTSQNDVSKIIPAYSPEQPVKPDIPSVTGPSGAVSDPGFLSYPSNPVKTVTAVPGKGGNYTTMTPLWGAIPPSSGNGYYDAVNKALGATLKIQPADGNNYGDTTLPPIFAADKMPRLDHGARLEHPASWTSAQAVEAKFADLTPYLAGDKAKEYPNLANVSVRRLGLRRLERQAVRHPDLPSGAQVNGTYFYREDVFDKLGIKAADIKTTADLEALGAQLTNKNAGVWAFERHAGPERRVRLAAVPLPQRLGPGLQRQAHPQVRDTPAWWRPSTGTPSWSRPATCTPTRSPPTTRTPSSASGAASRWSPATVPAPGTVTTPSRAPPPTPATAGRPSSC